MERPPGWREARGGGGQLGGAGVAKHRFCAWGAGDLLLGLFPADPRHALEDLAFQHHERNATLIGSCPKYVLRRLSAATVRALAPPTHHAGSRGESPPRQRRPMPCRSTRRSSATHPPRHGRRTTRPVVGRPRGMPPTLPTDAFHPLVEDGVDLAAHVHIHLGTKVGEEVIQRCASGASRIRVVVNVVGVGDESRLEMRATQSAPGGDVACPWPLGGVQVTSRLSAERPTDRKAPTSRGLVRPAGGRRG